MKMIKVFILMIIVIVFELPFAQDDEISRNDIRENIGLIIGVGVAVPLAFLGIRELSSEKIDGREDSILYYRKDKDNEAISVEKYNNEIIVKMGAFLLVDFITCAAIGHIFDEIIKKRKKEKEIARVNLSTDILNKRLELSLEMPICKLK